MKKLIMIVVTLALVTISGCYTVQSNSSKGGSVREGEGFKIAVPTFDVDMKQGDVQSVTVSVERGKSFKQDVKLEVFAVKGISVEPTSITVKASDMPEVQLRVTVPKEAALGAYLVSVKGTPKTGEPAATDFNIKVIAP